MDGLASIQYSKATGQARKVVSKSKYYLTDFGGLPETFSDCCQILLNIIFTINYVDQKRNLKQAANVTAQPNTTIL